MMLLPCYHLLWLLLCCLTVCFSRRAIDETSMERVLLCTIIDPANPTIVRDGLTLFRSLSLLGQSLNLAKKVVGIPLPAVSMSMSASVSMSVSNEVNMTWVRELVLQHHVQIHTFPAATPQYAGTMNKYTLLRRLNTLLVDYILWLDADTVILGDPLGYLPMHMQPGEIHCVPEFYSYMRRYPTINASNHFWNSNLPNFVLLGEGEVAPHGMCNTGVLYFDRMSLKSLLDSVDAALSFIPKSYHRDRFLDSLIFVYAINERAIPVSAFPYDLNYMAFFEGEILDLTKSTNVVIAHLLSDTEFYCELSGNEGCDCIYRNENMLSNSMLVPKLQYFLDLSVCKFMATGVAAITQYSERVDELCELHWPPANWVCPVYGSSIKIDFLIVCSVKVEVLSSYGMPHSTVTNTIEANKLTVFSMDFNESIQNSFNITHSLFIDNDSVGQLQSTIAIPNLWSGKNGKVVYSTQNLLGERPIALESQLNFYEYVSSLQSDEYSGVIICCQSMKGMKAVSNLLLTAQQSSKYALFGIHIFMTTLPNDFNGVLFSNGVPSDLQIICPLKCVFWNANQARDVSNVISGFESESVSFVFIDAYETRYNSSIETLQAAFKVLRRDGVILGTDYRLTGAKMGQLTPVPTLIQYNVKDILHACISSYSVLEFSLAIQHVLLFTYLEAIDEFCGSFGFENCYPAWYIRKIV